MSDERSVVIIGGGIIGSTIAHVLTEDARNKITIVARDMPEDLDSQAFASPWAGANWAPVGENSPRGMNWDKVTFDKLWSMIPTGLVMELPSRILVNASPEFVSNYKIWWKDIVRDFGEIAEDELPTGFNYGLKYTAVSLRPNQYLPWMKDQLVARGVKFVKKYLRSIDEALEFREGSGECIVINATGLGARSLLGVKDLAAHPVRGQTMLVRAPHVKECVIDFTNYKEDVTYLIPRPDGTVILGGTVLPDVWDTSINMETAQGILDRCSHLVPGVNPANGAEIISHNVGLRPARHGGARLEIEKISLPLNDPLKPKGASDGAHAGEMKVIHAYGFGPAGYQNSWGVAEDVAKLFKELVESSPGSA